MATIDYDSDLNLYLDTDDESDSDVSLALRMSSSESESSDAEDETLVPTNIDRWIAGDKMRAVPKSSFLGPPPGPTMDLPRNLREIDFFFVFFTAQVLNIIVAQTNLFAEQCQVRNGEDRQWTPVTLPEIQAWLGMRVAMSVLQLPNVDWYWSEDALFGGIRLASIMTRARFTKIAQYLHISDDSNMIPRGRQGHDKLHKVREIMELVRSRCLQCYNPHQNTSIDEAMVAFRGRLGFKQYLPSKPTKYGIKVWMRADPTNGYVNDFQVYTGKDGKVGEGGLGSRVVLDLIRPVKNMHHVVNCDNFFLSPHLCKELLDVRTYVRGTVRINRKDFPRVLLPEKKLKKQGDMVFAQKGEMIAASWRDKKVVNLLSTADNPESIKTTIQRKARDGSIMEVPSPSIVNNYNCYMNGVDRADQLRSELSTYRTSKRWWQYLFWFLFDISVCNAFVLMRESANHKLRTKNGKVKQRTMGMFRMALAKQLIGNYGTRKRKQLSNEDQAGNAHWPIECVKRKRCRQCSKKGIRKTVLFICEACDVGLCPACFKPFHMELLR